MKSSRARAWFSITSDVTLAAKTDVAADGQRAAVIDIGSNSVRLVVFEAATRAPLPVFNERVLCGLGRNLAAGGELAPEAAAQAHIAIGRFATLCRRMAIEAPIVVATAAVREAADGEAFVAEVAERTGLEVRVLSGRQEAEAAAAGVRAAFPGATGVMGDLGGGSLELVDLNAEGGGEGITLPLGPLRMTAGSAQTIDAALAQAPWLAGRGGDFHAVGGTWRALARIHMAQTRYAMRVVHHYAVLRAEAESFSAMMAGLGPDSLAGIPSINRARLAALPAAALVLNRLLLRLAPGKVLFSAWGLREGLLHQQLAPEHQGRDPLIAGCRAFSRGTSRQATLGGAFGDELAAWMEPLFAGESVAEKRLRLAACLLSDIAWRSHPDYRAGRAVEGTLYAPFTGLDHAGRGFLALAVNARYGGAGDRIAGTARALVDDDEARRAERVGLALRLAQTYSGGLPGLGRRQPPRDQGTPGSPSRCRRAIGRCSTTPSSAASWLLAEACGLEAVVGEGDR
ncbi:MAG: hypothetical protein QGG75_05500 [Alphaproteobacteria bacterium]|nr:hypothetical protein [Alphaproteobacteria bacterium]